MSFASLCNCRMTVYRAPVPEHDLSGGAKPTYAAVSELGTLSCSVQKQTSQVIDSFGARSLAERHWVGVPGILDIRKGDRLFVTMASGVTLWLVVEGIGDGAGRAHHLFLECDEVR